MDGRKRAVLRIVPTGDVRPHEIADPAREHRIELRLRADGILRDPLMVGAVPDVSGFVLLDGTNRQRALLALGCPWVLAQVLDYADLHAVQLQTWCHWARCPTAELLRGARGIPSLEATSLPTLAATDALTNPSTLAVLLNRSERYVLSRTGDQAPSRAEQLRQLVEFYEPTMSRVDCEAEDVEERVQTLDMGSPGTLLAFPCFTRSQVLTMAMCGSLIPAGITRHIVLGGRALRVNIPLDTLAGSVPIEAAQARLEQHLHTLQPRAYMEPTILYDS